MSLEDTTMFRAASTIYSGTLTDAQRTRITTILDNVGDQESLDRMVYWMDKAIACAYPHLDDDVLKDFHVEAMFGQCAETAAWFAMNLQRAPAEPGQIDPDLKEAMSIVKRAAYGSGLTPHQEKALFALARSIEGSESSPPAYEGPAPTREMCEYATGELAPLKQFWSEWDEEVMPPGETKNYAAFEDICNRLNVPSFIRQTLWNEVRLDRAQRSVPRGSM